MTHKFIHLCADRRTRMRTPTHRTCSVSIYARAPSMLSVGIHLVVFRNLLLHLLKHSDGLLVPALLVKPNAFLSLGQHRGIHAALLLSCHIHNCDGH